MKYSQKIVLKNGKEAFLRNGEASDGRAVYESFLQTIPGSGIYVVRAESPGFRQPGNVRVKWFYGMDDVLAYR